MSRLVYEKIGFGIMMVLGAIIFGLDILAYGKVSSDCTNKNVKLNLNVLLCLSAALITAGITYFICISGSECIRDESVDDTASTFFTLGIVVSAGMILSCIFILNEYKKLSNDANDLCGQKKGRIYVIGILSISIIAFIVFMIGLDFSRFGIVARMIKTDHEGGDGGSPEPTEMDLFRS